MIWTSEIFQIWGMLDLRFDCLATPGTCMCIAGAISIFCIYQDTNHSTSLQWVLFEESNLA